VSLTRLGILIFFLVDIKIMSAGAMPFDADKTFHSHHPARFPTTYPTIIAATDIPDARRIITGSIDGRSNMGG
jgi:hypothetical protein